MSSDPPPPLSARQLRALLDVLTHHETYREVQAFRDPATIAAYGRPFVRGDDGTGDDYASPSSAPILHVLFNRAVLTLPPAERLPPAFWRARVQALVAQLGATGLSESYDKGALGTRKTLATAASAVIEALARGVWGGCPGEDGSGGPGDLDGPYDTTQAAACQRAWDDVLRGLVHGDLVSELYAFSTTHACIEDHSPAVRAAAEHIILHLADALHYVLVRAPNGRALTRLLAAVHQRLPYALLRQTLRVGNAASMVRALMKLLLAKLSVGGLTNWVGLTAAADDGMNLLQRIISYVLSANAAPFQQTAERIEKAAAAADKESKSDSSLPSCAHLAAVRQHLDRPPAQRDAVRAASIAQGQSAVAAVLASAEPPLPALARDAQHRACAQYYAALLAVRDHRAIADVLCRQTPDRFTQAVRDGVAAFDPILRSLHEHIDLKEHVRDAEAFVGDLLCVSQGAAAGGGGGGGNDDKMPSDARLPTVADYVALLRRHRHRLHKWLHRVSRDTPAIHAQFRDWSVDTIGMFRPDHARGGGGAGGGAGALSDDLAAQFAALPVPVQDDLRPRLNAHAAYLDALNAGAAAQRQRLLDEVNTAAGGGGGGGAAEKASSREAATGAAKRASISPFLARWQALLDDTCIGPATAHGPLRCGRDVAPGHAEAEAAEAAPSPLRPDVGPVVDALGTPFRQLLESWT